MRKIVIFAVLLGLLLPAGYASAATVIVQNYFYAHANTPGTHYFTDKYGTQGQYGDNVQHDAVIKSVTISAQGMQSGDQIIVYQSDGGSHTATPGTQLTLNVPKSVYIRIAIVKSGYNEVFAKLDEMTTFDDSDGGTNVLYRYSVNEIPTSYGQLGPGSGSGGGTLVDGNYYYFPPQDSYKYDYIPPSGVSYYELHFDGAAGHFFRTYNQTPTGVHYLTCNGSYEMRFYDSGGTVVAKSQTMTTTQIQNPTCNSQPGGTGFQDFNIYKQQDPDFDDADELVWDAYPGAYNYMLYKDGVLIDTANTTKVRIWKDNASYTVVAVGMNGNFLAQADLLGSTPGGGDPGGGSCGGCDKLKEILECPEWQQYLGGLTQAIKNAWPTPPYWQGVADIFRDTIVPEMGAEIVRRAPAVARIIADEFESREDPVRAPGSLATYNPPFTLPTPTDMPSKIPFDLNSGVPSFEPDYSGSQPFTIPDPLNIQLDDTDAGYNAPDPKPSNNPIPIYQGSDPTPEPDPGYGGSGPQDDISVPGYVVTNPDATAPSREYQMNDVDDGSTIPGYKPPPDDPGNVPGYQLPDAPMPSYKREGE